MIYLADRLDRVRFGRRLIRPQANDPGKPQRIAAFMAIGFHHVVKSDFEDDFWFHDKPEALVFPRVLEKPSGHLSDF